MNVQLRFYAIAGILAVMLAAFGVACASPDGRPQIVHRALPPSPSPAPARKPNPYVAAYPGLKTGAVESDGHYYRNRVLVLMYHDVSPSPTDVRSLSVRNLERQLLLMKENHFHWIDMAQYRDFILHDRPVPENAVLLTFDDGYESFYRYAYPVLLKYQAPASSFLIVNTIGNPAKSGVEKLNWDQVKEMHRHGIDFFSHTYDLHAYANTDARGKHPEPALAARLWLKNQGRRESEQEYESRIETDLRQANARLKAELGSDNHVLAFPYGAFSASALNVCRKLGIDVTLTVKAGINGPGQTNGFRLNAGGMNNDPHLQIALMKQASQRLGNVHLGGAQAGRSRSGVPIAALTTRAG